VREEFTRYIRINSVMTRRAAGASTLSMSRLAGNRNQQRLIRRLRENGNGRKCIGRHDDTRTLPYRIVHHVPRVPGGRDRKVSFFPIILPRQRNPAQYSMDGCSIFREELALRYPAHGHALWEPDPGGLYEAVEVGDVGFIRNGYFHRLFNALRPPVVPSDSDASHGLKYPPKLQPRNPNHIRKDRDNHQDFCSPNVRKQLQEIYSLG
jgi:hypothetical protein